MQQGNVVEIDPDLEQRQTEERRRAQLASFAAGLFDKRKQAIEHRELSGIEGQWLEDEEYYNGVDDYNRGQYMLKPSTKEGRVTETKKKGDPARSTAFVNITQPYVDLVSAREFDMLFPVDDKPFAFEPTPVPDIEKAVDSTEMMPDGEVTEGEAAKMYLKEAKDKADAAEEQVWDWLAESNWHTEGRKVIRQKNMIGTGVLKGPFPVMRERSKLGQDDGGNIIVEKSVRLAPATKMIDAWNLYPDPACGNNIHNGSYIWEKDSITGKQLRNLKKQQGYLAYEIDRVLEEGPDKKYLTDDARRNRNAWFLDQDTYKVWYYHGYASQDDLIAANCPCEHDGLDVCVIMVNDRVIKASQSVLDSGEFPYDVFVYQERQDYWAGIGVARQVRTAQDIVNAATRAMLDNSGMSAGPQVIFRKGIVTPADGVYSITPHKLWYVDEDSNLQDVRDAFMSIVIPNNQQHMEAVIRLALEMAERTTSMPLLLQGQQGAATDTVGGMQILQQNSNTVLRRCAKLFDDVVERHISRYYDWLLQYHEDDNIKGDFNIVVKGSSALYERDAQNQMILQLVQYAADPGFALSKERLMVEILKSNKVSPDRVCLTDEEKKQLQQQPPPEDPAVQVAKVKIEGEMQKEHLKQQNDERDIALKQDEMEAGFALKLQLHEKDAELKRDLAAIQRDLKIMELAQSSQQSIDEIKAALARDALKLRVQKELSQSDHDHQAVMEVIKPAAEPPGRARDGHSFTE